MKLQLLFRILSITAVLMLNGCIKFDDPSLSQAPDPIIYSSPCTNDLDNDQSQISTTTDFIVNNYFFIGPNCNGTTIQGNPSSGTFQIVLSEPITESRTYALDFPFIDDGEAQIQFAASGFAQPTFSSTSGTLYVEVLADGTTIIEWCDIPCQATSGIPNQKTSGRMVCD